ncbi:MAG: hypothetical protein COA59_03325 [Colwellia sp.]|nr:MAG: hypothetical protein COA59_03325 [Colwellia sp.]
MAMSTYTVCLYVQYSSILSYLHRHVVLLEKALAINNSLIVLIVLIISVGFLKLRIHSTFSSKVLPKGNVSLWKNLMSLQLFGDVALWAPFLAAAMVLSKNASYGFLLIVGFSLSNC